MTDNKEDLVGRYSITDVPLGRIPTIDVLEMGIRKHQVTALLEIDVTNAREIIRSYELRSGDKLSFTAWIVTCISKSMEAHKQINSYLDVKKRKLITFEDFDVTVIVEKQVEGERIPLPYVVRKVNTKTIRDIGEEIHQFKTNGAGIRKEEVSKKQIRGLTTLGLRLPQWIRMLFWKRIGRDPLFAKRTMGTAVVTSVGMFGSVNGYVIPNTIFTSCFALGSIVSKPSVIGDDIMIREHLFMTVIFDHDIVDGGPAARFVGDMVSLIEKAYGLEELTPKY